MRTAWTINAIPAPQQQQQQQPQLQQQQQQAHQKQPSIASSQPQSQQQQPPPPSNLQHYFASNKKVSSVPVSAPPICSIPDEYTTNELPNAVRRIFWPEMVNTPYFRDKVNANIQPPSNAVAAAATAAAQQFHHPSQIVS